MTLANITFQNFFNKYDKKCGMTGTALTEEQEFRDIYGMDVVEIPTNKPVIRQDLEDAVYKTKKEKYHAVVEEVKKAHAKGQPVLVGTITIDISEEISRLLKREGIPHRRRRRSWLTPVVTGRLPSPPTWRAVVPISSWTRRPEPRVV